MASLLRIGLALVMALTVCIGGWAGLQALGVQRPAYAKEAGGNLGQLDPGIPQPAPPLAPRALPGDEAAPFRTRPRVGAATIELRGKLPWARGELLIRSAWSQAIERRIELTEAAPLRIDQLRLGEHIATAVEADAGASDSWFARATFTVREAEPVKVTLDLTGGTLGVTATDGNQPLARALVALERLDDPRWCASVPTPTDGGARLLLTDAKGQLTLGPLGAGRYRVRCGDAASDVDVPGTTTVTLRCATR
jgi:hypothetical protein